MTTRVAIFVDGQNFWHGWQDHTQGFPFEWPRLMKWVVDKVGGDQLFGVFYYSGESPGTPIQNFLNRVEQLPAFFVRRFGMKSKIGHCPLCDKDYDYLQEKEVDTSIVADMVRMAAMDSYDVAVLVSGDADLAPALESIQVLGKIGWVATWKNGLSTRVRQTAYGVLDMVDAMDDMQEPVEKVTIVALPTPAVTQAVKDGLSIQEPGLEPTPPAPEAPPVPILVTHKAKAEKPLPPPKPELPKFSKDEMLFMEALDRASKRLPYVGVRYFLHQWDFRDESMADTALREVVMEDLINRGVLHVFEYRGDGSKALGFKNRPDLEAIHDRENRLRTPLGTLADIMKLGDRT